MKRAAQDGGDDRLKQKSRHGESDVSALAAVPSAAGIEPPAVVHADDAKGDDDSVDAGDKKPKAVPAAETDQQTNRRKPKNFAERLMEGLQSGAAQDAVWWVGNGEAIAINPRNLKEGDFLSTHFKVKDYSVFIRNCNRWGFRRTMQYPVEQGVITYQCSLFQRNQQELCRHMRMDSDVQDVFVRHRQSAGDDVPFDPKRIGRASYASRGVTAPAASGRWPPRQDEQDGLVRVAAKKQTAQLLSRDHLARVAANHQTAPAVLPSSSNNSLLQSLSRDQMLRLLQNPDLAKRILDAQSSVAAADSPSGSAATPAAHATTEARLAVADLLAQASGRASEEQDTPQEKLLNQILDLAQEYLDHPTQPPPHENSESIGMVMRLLKIQGDKYKEEKKRRERKAHIAPSGGALDVLRNQLVRPDSASRLLKAEQSVQRPANSRAPGTAPVAGSFLAEILQRPQQPQPPLLPPGFSQSGNSPLVENLLQQFLAQRAATTLFSPPAPALPPTAPARPPAAPASNPDAVNQLMHLLGLQQNRHQN
ncbi:HSF-type DNA-binding [Seminavis robusta]|uniref:HSF-type DNA-binding n=1 Tax=Seminavis robusta TaxID=568900 RepID=A0A9N8ERZ6_9STRA|nr:HSF-type DNA-binding [Seminavis robusta]|eukprot:Sro1787_g297530.1 HSF-type DNA-binding (536) ;mRNA; r:11995-13926